MLMATPRSKDAMIHLSSHEKIKYYIKMISPVYQDKLLTYGLLPVQNQY